MKKTDQAKIKKEFIKTVENLGYTNFIDQKILYELFAIGYNMGIVVMAKRVLASNEYKDKEVH
jgi:hypothetical protein